MAKDFRRLPVGRGLQTGAAPACRALMVVAVAVVVHLHWVVGAQAAHPKARELSQPLEGEAEVPASLVPGHSGQNPFTP